jgi:Mg2+ and Co2+ transporter CorA
VPYPTSGTPTGVAVSALLMLVCAVALYFGFKRKGWL